MKNKRNIIIAAAVILVLIAGIIAVSLINTGGKQTNDEGTRTNTIYSENASDLAEVRVVTADGEIRAVNKGKSDWTINDLPSDEIDPQKAYSLAGTVSTIISKNEFEAEDLTQFGLDNPKITVTITKKNGDEDTLYIGDLSPVLGEYFIMKEGADKVYTLYSYKVDTLLKPLEYYKEFNRFHVVIDDITEIKTENSSGGYDIKIKDVIDENTNNVWEMVSPYTSGANDDYIDNKILARIENISMITPVADNGYFTGDTAIVTLTVKPYDNETGKYGDEYTETFEIGKTEGETAYVRYNGEVYETPADSVEFARDSAFNIVSKLQALVDISLVRSVDVEYDGEKHTIGINKESGNKYSFTLDGKETDAKVSQEIYRNIIALPVDAVYNGGEIGGTVLKLTFNGIKKADDKVVEFKTLDELSCTLSRNGETSFTIKTSKLNEFITVFDAYVKSYE